MKLRAVVVGLGQIGMGYDAVLDPVTFLLTHCRSFEQHPEFDLLTGIDPEQHKRETFENIYGRKSYATIEEAALLGKADVVAISTPTDTHGKILELVLDVFSPDIIVCEKPLSFNLLEAERMVSLCGKKNCRMYVNYMRRSNPGVTKIKEMLDSGNIKTPVKGVAWYSKGLLNNGSHLLDTLQFWLGNIAGFKIIEVGRKWQGRDPEPDFAINFEGGKIYFMVAKEEDFSYYTIEIISPNGRLTYDCGRELMKWSCVVADPIYPGYRTLSTCEESVDTDSKRSQLHFLDQIICDVNGVGANVCKGDEALETLRWMDRIRAEL